ncbi:hypothetical protein [Pseudomonas sp. NPDC007930]|uniref:hypothetical protein n=1 Tax=Pseudomonas sp. NPDC007930 TaxID=3364417 RepID=UPI0036F19123
MAFALQVGCQLRNGAGYGALRGICGMQAVTISLRGERIKRLASDEALASSDISLLVTNSLRCFDFVTDAE